MSPSSVPESSDWAGLSRRTLVGSAAGVAASLAVGPATPAAAATGPRGPGSVSGVPRLPAGFTRTFKSVLVDTGAVRLHAVVGGSGPALLLIHGWPENWYAWRLVMPELARHFRVVAVDQRGMGISGKPADGYDTGTLAGDLVALMDALGHQRFSVVGHDTGMVIAYALAADHRDRVDRLAVAETTLPGVVQGPLLFVDAPTNDVIWHIPFNRIHTTNELLVRDREDIFFGFEFAHRTVKPMPDYVLDYYIGGFAASRDALRGSFEFYRAIDATTAQNKERAKQMLTLPVLAIAGGMSSKDTVFKTMSAAASDVQSLIVPDCGHFVAEEKPDALLAGLLPFLAP
ncbi:alpha/beta hydrolase [Streptomyces sp. NPDC046821]|uniref:alpha/beta fold hydrolase n=1 Tax=Streptomyces sp. NPDC046821 TaxID=3154702 RepID=UPI0033C726EF